MNLQQCTRVELPEPRSHTALIGCQIQLGPSRTWTNRTYTVTRGEDNLWRVDFGNGPVEPRSDWAAVVGWLRSLGARDVELLEGACS